MATIRLERVPIQVANLGWFGFDHLHVALQQDDLVINQDRWYVMEGLRDTSQAINRLGVLGTDGTTTLSEANGNLTGDELTAALGTPAWRGSNIISFSGFEFEKWFEMVRYANEFEAQQFPYIGYANPFGATATINSTSVIASLLYYVGIDITQYFGFLAQEYQSRQFAA